MVKATESSPSLQRVMVILVVLAAASIPYLLHFDIEFRSDDWVLISKGVEHGIFEGLVHHFTHPFCDTWVIEFYRPLFTWSFCLEGHLFGDHALAYGVVNLVWHLLSLLFAGLVLQRLLPFRWAWLAVALFAVSPWSANNVAWIAGSCGTVSGFFTWFGAWGYLRFVDRAKGRWPWLAFIAMTIGVFYRETTLFLPFLCFLFDVTERRHDLAAFMRWVFLGLPFVGYMLAKRLVLGTFVGGYERMNALRGSLPPEVETTDKAWEATRAVLDLLAPGPGDDSPDWSVLRFIAFAAVAIILVLGVMGGVLRRRSFWVSAAFLVVNVIPLLSVDRVVHSGTAQRWYTVMWAVAAIYAACIATASATSWIRPSSTADRREEGGRSSLARAASIILVPRRIALAAFLFLCVWSSIRLLDNLRWYDDSARLSRAVRKTVAEQPQDLVFVYNLLGHRGAAAFYSLGLGYTQRPPFGPGTKTAIPIMATQRFGPLMSDQVPLGPRLRVSGRDVGIVWIDYDTFTASTVPDAILARFWSEVSKKPRLELVSPSLPLTEGAVDLLLDLDATGYERIDVFLMTPGAQVHLPRIRILDYETARFDADGHFREDLRRMLEYAMTMDQPVPGRCWLWVVAYTKRDDVEGAAVSEFFEIHAAVPVGRPPDRK